MRVERLGRRDERPTLDDARLRDDAFEFTLDPDWRIVSITKSAAAWAGSTVDDLVGRDGRGLNPLATKSLAGGVEAALATGAVSNFEQPSTHVQGRWVRIEIGPHADGVRVRFDDITSEVAARQLLEPFEEAGPEPLGEGPVEIALLDRRGVIVATNTAWRAGIAALGLNQCDAGAGARYSDVAKTIVPETDDAAFPLRLEDLFCGRVSAFEATFNQRAKEGYVRRQVRIGPIRMGRETYFVAMHEDLTERARVLAQLHETSDQLLHAQEKERQRIAVELHDSTSQHLAGLVLNLGSLRRQLNDPAARALIEEMDKLAQQAVQETRVLAYLLNASGRDPEGLEAAARRFIEGFGRRTGLKTTFEARGPVDAVDAAAQHAMFRVIQEALTNVYRHAQAKEALVSLVNGSGQLVLRVADDGRGMEPATPDDEQAPLGVGVSGMRARIEQLGGRLEIENGGKGTIVSATLPLDRTESRPLA